MKKRMSRKSKGINAERELVHMLRASNFACIRVAASGATKYCSPDLIAGNKDKKFVIECKVTKDDKKYLDNQEVLELNEFAQQFGAVAYIAVKFLNRGWGFYEINDLENSGKMFAADINKKKMFEEIIN